MAAPPVVLLLLALGLGAYQPPCVRRPGGAAHTVFPLQTAMARQAWPPGSRACAPLLPLSPVLLLPPRPVLRERVGVRVFRMVVVQLTCPLRKTLTLPSPGVPGEGNRGAASWPVRDELRGIIRPTGGIFQPRATPWVYRECNIQALKGRHKGRFEKLVSPFQGLNILVSGNPGRCPGLKNAAPLGLKRAAGTVTHPCPLPEYRARGTEGPRPGRCGTG